MIKSLKTWVKMWCNVANSVWFNWMGRLMWNSSKTPRQLMCWRDEGQMVEPVDVEIVSILTIISQDPWCVFFPHWCYTQWLQGWMLLLVWNKVSWQHSLRTRAGSVEICHESCKELRIDYDRRLGESSQIVHRPENLGGWTTPATFE